ncbi:hypothetical protein AgCh_022409 [Apium graveolens]
MRAALMWTISDFPAYFMLSGWKTIGQLAFPHCANDHDADNLSRGGKTTWRVKENKILSEDNGMDDEDDKDGLCELQEKFREPVDRNALCPRAVGGSDKKNRVYRVGSSESIFYNSNNMPYSSSFTVEEENQKLKYQLTEINERVKVMENQLAKIIETNSARLSRPPFDLDGQNDNN